METARLNHQVANWNGSAYSFRPMTAAEANQADLFATAHPATGAQAPVENPSAGAADNLFAGGGLADMVSSLPRPPAPPGSAPARAPAGSTRAGFTQEIPPVAPVTGFAPKAAPTNIFTSPLDTYNVSIPTSAPATPAVGTPGGPEAGAQAPDIHRDKIDTILGGLSGYENEIANLGRDNTGLSVAEAQLQKADALAKIRARDELAANQAGALGQARSVRNRGDQALMQRVAVGEQAYLGSQAQRADTLRQAELEGNLAVVRATEENADRQFKLDALKTAAGLGLNTAALEVDISKADLASANNWVNDEAQKALQSGALDEAQYEALLNYTSTQTGQLLDFTKAMAGIQYEYDKLSVDDQNVADQLLMQRYGIDQQTMIALKQIKQSGKFRWDQVLTALVGGAATGATGGIAGVVAGTGGAAETPLHDWNNT